MDRTEDSELNAEVSSRLVRPREQLSSLYDIATHHGMVTASRAVVAALGEGGPVETCAEECRTSN